MSRPGALALATAVVVLSLLTGCAPSADDSPEETNDTTSDSPSPTQSTDTAYVPASADGPAQNVPKPTKPPQADEESLEGAQAFLDYLTEARVYAFQTGDTSLVREITSDACETCMDEYDRVEEHYAEGGWSSSAREKASITDDVLGKDSQGLWAVRAKMTFDGVTEWDENGKVLVEIPGSEVTGRVSMFHLDHEADRWIFVSSAPVD